MKFWVVPIYDLLLPILGTFALFLRWNNLICLRVFCSRDILHAISFLSRKFWTHLLVRAGLESLILLLTAYFERADLFVRGRIIKFQRATCPKVLKVPKLLNKIFHFALGTHLRCCDTLLWSFHIEIIVVLLGVLRVARLHKLIYALHIFLRHLIQLRQYGAWRVARCWLEWVLLHNLNILRIQLVLVKFPWSAHMMASVAFFHLFAPCYHFVVGFFTICYVKHRRNYLSCGASSRLNWKDVRELLLFILAHRNGILPMLAIDALGGRHVIFYRDSYIVYGGWWLSMHCNSWVFDFAILLLSFGLLSVTVDYDLAFGDLYIRAVALLVFNHGRDGWGRMRLVFSARG